MPSPEIVDAMALMRHQAFKRLVLYKDTQDAFLDQKKFIAHGINGAQNNGAIHVNHDGSALRAFLMHWTEKDSWYGAETQNCVIHLQPNDPKALAWTEECLRREMPNFNSKFDLILDAAYEEVRLFFLNRRFHIDALILIGETGIALQQLGPNKSSNATTKDLGLEIAPLTNDSHVEEISNLKQKVFSRNRGCWFALNPEFIKHEKEELLKSIAQNQPLYIIQSGDGTVGFFGAHIERSNTYWGDVGNLEFVLDCSLQGKGLARQLYRIVLQDLKSLAVTKFKGGTSNPAVLHLSKTMGRELSATVIRKNPSSQKDFAPYIRS